MIRWLVIYSEIFLSQHAGRPCGLDIGYGNLTHVGSELHSSVPAKTFPELQQLALTAKLKKYKLRDFQLTVNAVNGNRTALRSCSAF